MRLFSNRKIQLVLNGGFGLVLLGVAIVSIRHFMGAGWPIHHADPLLVTCAALLFLAAYAFKAWGWQRLFHASERPTADALAFAGGAACVGGIALPGRVDDAVRIAIVKRYPGTKTGIGTLGLSLIVLGLLDNAALTPMASVAAAGSSHWTTRAGFAVVAAAGVAAAAVVAFLPRIARHAFLQRWRVGRWLAQHTHCTKEAWAAWLLISISWTLRGVAVFLLLNALSMPGSYVGGLADRPGGRGDPGGRGCSDPRARRHRHGRRGRVLDRRSGARHRDRRRGDAPHRFLAARAPAPRLAHRARRGCSCGRLA
jgi:hypothetical protein